LKRWKSLRSIKSRYFWLALIIINFATAARAEELPLDLIKLPPGFKIEIYAQGIRNARGMALGPKGTLFVGSFQEGKLYAIVDADKNNKADRVYLIADKLSMPIGVAFRGNSLYVSDLGRILRYDNIEDNLEKPLEPAVVTEQLPRDTWHGAKYIQFGPDGLLSVPVGAPCNSCEPASPWYQTILRMQPNGDEMEVFASGIRNSVGFTWDPKTNEMWFTDNGRDNLGDDIPSDELNHAPQKGMNFGFPYCHQGDIPDPLLGAKHACSEFTPPALKTGAHVAGLGLKFYTGQMFPQKYQGRLFLAQHGSWNRSQKIGYRVMMAEIKDNKVVSYEPFAQGWNVGNFVWGRPVDILIMPDGAMLVSDDHAGVIYRIYYHSP
jgi:glucose/arabinose dehydrogenase